jgi:hypothetical protein
MGSQRVSYGAHIVASLIRHSRWTHFLMPLPLKDPLARAFHAQMCGIERWIYRQVRIFRGPSLQFAVGSSRCHTGSLQVCRATGLPAPDCSQFGRDSKVLRKGGANPDLE